jgi:hypothetical protein
VFLLLTLSVTRLLGAEEVLWTLLGPLRAISPVPLPAAVLGIAGALLQLPLIIPLNNRDEVEGVEVIKEVDKNPPMELPIGRGLTNKGGGGVFCGSRFET